MTWQKDAKRILITVFGLLNAGAGGYFLFLEMQRAESHSVHVYIFTAWVAVGMLIVAPSVIGGALRTVVGMLPSVKIGKSE